MPRRPSDPAAEPEPERHADPVAEQPGEPIAEQQEQQQPVVAQAESRRRWSAWSFAAGAGLVAAVVLLAGGTSWVVARAAAATPDAVAPTSSPAAMTGQHAGKQVQRAGVRAVRGSITAIEGSTWTVKSRKGETVTVTVGAATQYGRPGSSSAASDFHVGESVAVVGTGKDGTISAKRIVPLPAPSPSATPTT